MKNLDVKDVLLEPKKIQSYLENPFKELKQYALDRNIFCEIYGDCTEWVNMNHPYEGYAFKAWYHDDDWYILHKLSGTLINWYKHCGRINTCNKELTIEQHKEFAKMFLSEINGDCSEYD